MNEQAYLRSLGWGRYSYDYLYPKYLEELERLGSKYLNGHNESVSNDKNHAAYVDELMKLNNDFAGLGLATNVMASGIDKVSSSFVTNNLEMMGKMTSYNGEVETIRNALSALPSWELTNFEKAHQAWLFAQDQKQRDRVNAWREKMWAEEAKEENEKNAIAKLGQPYFKNWNDIHHVRGYSLFDGARGRPWAKQRSVNQIRINIFGGKGKHNMIKNGKLKGAISIQVTIKGVSILGPDYGSGTSYKISFFNNDNTSAGKDFIYYTPPGPNQEGGNKEYIIGIPAESQPIFNINGGYMLINVNHSYDPVYGYDGCWNIGIIYNVNAIYR